MVQRTADASSALSLRSTLCLSSIMITRVEKREVWRNAKELEMNSVSDSSSSISLFLPLPRSVPIACAPHPATWPIHLLILSPMPRPGSSRSALSCRRLLLSFLPAPFSLSSLFSSDLSRPPQWGHALQWQSNCMCSATLCFDTRPCNNGMRPRPTSAGAASASSFLARLCAHATLLPLVLSLLSRTTQQDRP